MKAAALEAALATLRAGDARAAAAICRDALAAGGEDADLLGVLGACLNAAQDPAAALPVLGRALELEPAHARVLEQRGRALLQLRRVPEAIEALRAARDLAPASAAIARRLAQALLADGRGEEADAVIAADFARDPLQQALLAAAQQQREGRYRASEAPLRGVLRERPDDVNALRLLARVAEEAGRPAEAERLLARALELAPGFDDARLDRARVLRQLERIEEAVGCAGDVVARSPRNPLAHYLHGGLLAIACRHADALDAYARSIALQPDNPAAFTALGHLLKTLGRQAEAIEAYRAAIRLRPALGEVFWSLANLKTFRFTDDEIAAMERALAEPALDADARVHFLFALAKATEDAGAHAEAFRLYERANAEQRGRIAYDPVETEVLHARIRATFDANFLAARAAPPVPGAPVPIFIVGMPRSGSTLVEQILASHSLVDGTAELPDIARLAAGLARRVPGRAWPEAVADLDAGALRALGEEYLERTRRERGDRPFFTDKMPNNFAAIGLIHLILPQAIVIDARRHPLDSCLGCFRQHFALGQSFSYDLLELGEFYLEYRRLMEHWHAVLPGRVLEFRHEHLVREQEAQTRRLLAWCGLPWEADCLAFHRTERAVRTASSEQVRLPLYDGALNRWRHHRAELAPLIEIVGPTLAREGWDPVD